MDPPSLRCGSQSFGATYHGRRSCGVSTLGCTSFFPSEPLGCYGDGGAIFTDDDAIVLAKWPRFAWEVERRREIGLRYSRLLTAAGIPSIQPMKVRGFRTSVYAQYTVTAAEREVVRATLQAAQIPTAVHYPVPANKQPGYRSLGEAASTPVAEWLAQHVLSLPMGPDLTLSDQDAVIAGILMASTATGGESSVIRHAA